MYFVVRSEFPCDPIRVQQPLFIIASVFSASQLRTFYCATCLGILFRSF